jgi:hypothetical protein
MTLGLVMSALGAAAPAQAVAPTEPSGLVVEWPDPATVILSWTPSPGAARYSIEISDNVGFTNPLVKDSTASTTYVPTAKLKPGTWYWHVQAVSSANEVSGWTFSDFSVDNVPVPVLNSPSDNQTLVQPNDAPLLTWSMPTGAGAAGVDSYKVEVSNNGFTTAKTYSTKSTSLVVPDPLSLGTWQWRVTAVKSSSPLITSSPSDPRSFDIQALAEPEIVGPRNNIAVTDIVLDWNPVDGAKGYELQVSKTTDFSGALVDSRMGNNMVLGTNYSPPKTWDNNNTYYWQVRAVDAAGNSSEWAKSGTPFKRNYPYAPSLVYPTDGAQDVPAPYYFDWTSVKHASRYQFQIADNVNMTNARTCMLAGTTYTPGVFRYKDTEPVQALKSIYHENCDVFEGKTNYWRVRALDRPFTDPNDPPNVIEGLEGDDWSPKYSFKAGGMNVTGVSTSRAGLPTISWDPAVGAHSYNVQVSGPGAYSKNVNTFATSWTPDGKTKLVAGTYTVNIFAKHIVGEPSLIVTRNFTISDTIPTSGAPALALLEPADGTTVSDVPLLKWEPMSGAAYYKVTAVNSDNVRVTGSTSLFEKPVPYPTMTDTSDLLEKEGLYTWYVEAFAADDSSLGFSGTGTFRIAQIASVTGNELALTGQELDHNRPAGVRTPCTSDPDSGPCSVPATPVFRWDPVPNTAFYVLYLAEDANFTQLVEPTLIAATTNTMWAPTREQLEWSLADSESDGVQNPTSYYWYVMPCRTLTICGDDPRSANVAQHTFTKKSPAVTGQSTTQTDGKEITFEWDDYWHDAQSSDPDDKWSRTGENLPQSAMQYRIEISKDTTFAGNMLVERLDVDQPTYTSFTKTYAPGTYYWRVQALDDFGNALTWSDFDPTTPERENATFTIDPPRVELTSPIANASVPGTVAFTWKAQAYAKGYDIEVYKDDDTTFSAANRVASQQFTNGQFGGVLTTAWTWNSVLPASSKAYLWRVRRVDSSGNPGHWSTAGRFFVNATALSITSPLEGGTQPPDAPVVRWTKVPGASTYSVDIRPQSGGSGTTDSGTAIGTAYASKRAFTTGTYVASVTARDASGNAVGTAQVTFSVDSRLVALSAPTISAPSGTDVGATLTSTDPVWNKPGVVTSYQWLRNDAVIAGATGPTYALTTNDVGKTIALRATGKLPNYANGDVVSNGIAIAGTPGTGGGGAGGAIAATSPPTVSGTPSVGGFLTARNGLWTPTSGVMFKYQWLRDGAPIVGAASTVYRVTEVDITHTLSVQVVGTKAGMTDGVATSAGVVVPKVSSITSVTAFPTTITRSQRAKLTIRVNASAVTKPTGTLVIKDGRKTVKKITLKESNNGIRTYRLPRLKVGKHKIKVTYRGSTTVNKSKSKTLKLIVRAR